MKELNFNDRSKWEQFFTLEKWIWAMSIVSSRSAMVPRKGLVIAIYTDLFNHKSQPRDYAVLLSFFFFFSFLSLFLLFILFYYFLFFILFVVYYILENNYNK